MGQSSRNCNLFVSSVGGWSSSDERGITATAEQHWLSLWIYATVLNLTFSSVVYVPLNISPLLELDNDPEGTHNTCKIISYPTKLDS